MAPSIARTTQLVNEKYRLEKYRLSLVSLAVAGAFTERLKDHETPEPQELKQHPRSLNNPTATAKAFCSKH
jgi:hypothetical protein